MIELDRHIEILLLDNDCVIVPNLGGFMTNHVEARYDDRDNMFLPPLRTLGFNPKIRLNDSLLAQSYIEAYDISYPEAILRIEDEVDELRQHLQNEGSYELNDIGTLFMNEDGNVEFTPFEAGILTPELYALSNFEIVGITSVVARKRKIESHTTTNATKEAKTVNLTSPLTEEKNDSSARVLPIENAANEVHEGAEDNRTISIRISVLRNLAAAAIAIVAFLLFTTPLGNGTQQVASVDSSVLKHIMTKDITQGVHVEKAVEHKKNDDSSSNKTTNKTTEPQTETLVSPHYFTLVLASRVTKTNATNYANELRSQGYEAEVITQTSTKVICGKYESQDEAYQALAKLRDNGPFKEAWVLEIKN